MLRRRLHLAGKVIHHDSKQLSTTANGLQVMIFGSSTGYFSMFIVLLFYAYCADVSFESLVSMKIEVTGKPIN
jgi:hypothetical protein